MTATPSRRRFVKKDELGKYLGDKRLPRVVRRVGGRQVRGWRGLALTDIYAGHVDRLRQEDPERIRQLESEVRIEGSKPHDLGL
jgi:hypothetical protein